MADYGDLDREMILANFQGITGIENLDECITLLDHHDWDLMTCVNSVLGNSTAVETVDSPLRSTCTPPFVLGESIPLQHPPRRLRMLVEWHDKTITLALDDTETVGTIKRMLELQVGVPTSQQSLMGWSNQITISDSSVLKSLNLREETTLVLLTPKVTETPKEVQPCSSKSLANGEASASYSCKAPKNHHSIEKVMLCIQHKENEFNLPYPVSKSVGEVKVDIHSLTGLPVRKQCWSGWPDGVTDNMSLGEAELSFPVHVLMVKKRQSPKPLSDISKASPVDIDMEITNCDSSDNEEDASILIEEDELFNDLPCARKQIHEMLPNNCTDTAEALVKFTTQFEERYGDQHPHFYMGPLSEAIKEANGSSAKERKALLVYLHHDGSILTNVFCSQLLCANTIVNYISENFLIWAWDMTHDTNQARFLEMATQNFGSVAASTVRGFGPEQFPLMLVVMKNRSAMEVCSVLQGSATLDELITGLMGAQETFHQAMLIEIKNEDEREARESVKREQDEAYEVSLREDRAKAEEKRRTEEEEILSIKLEQERELHEAQVKEAQRLSLIDQLPAEPGPECTAPVSSLRFRLPNGEILTKQFLASNPLQVVMTFVQSRGFLDNEYKVVLNFPRRELSTMDSSQSLQAVGLYPQETIFVEER